MQDIVKLTKNMKAQFLRSLICHFSCLCKKSREKRIREKISSRFDDKLDIRSFVSVHTSLALLLGLMLTKEQLLLFKVNRVHTISQDLAKSDRDGTKDNYDREFNRDSVYLPKLELATMESLQKS